MAHAKKLEAEAVSMKAKIQELEEALASARTGGTQQNSSFLASKSPQDCGPNLSMQPDYQDIEQVTTELGSFTMGPEGQTRYHGTSAGSEVSLFRSRSYLKY
jgi:hypothetical protein